MQNVYISSKKVSQQIVNLFAVYFIDPTLFNILIKCGPSPKPSRTRPRRGPRLRRTYTLNGPRCDRTKHRRKKLKIKKRPRALKRFVFVGVVSGACTAA